VLSGYRSNVVRGSIRPAVPAKGVDLMNGVRLSSLELVSVLLLTGILGSFTGLARGDDSCATKRCQNPSAIQDMRDSIAAACDCAGASSAAKYMGCVKRTIKQAISAGSFSTACKGAVVKCEAAVGCGKGIRPFRTVQDIFSQSCALPSCHSTIARQGGLSLDSEDVSYASLVNRPVTATENAAPGALLVKPGDPKDSFLIQKLLGTAPGSRMPQSGEPLSKGTIKLISQWIKRGAKTTAEECPPADSPGAKKRGKKSCNDRPLRAGTFVWTPQPPLDPPAPGTGFQMHTPPRNVDPGTEWERCYAFKNIDWLGMAAQMGYPAGSTPVIREQTYRMHEGSHHLLLYAYYGPNPQEWNGDGYFPCNAANCTDDNPNDCPTDASKYMLPIGGTQVAGVRYDVTYPPTVGIPVLSTNMVLIVDSHFTNPFQPPQEIYGENWLNIYFYKPGEFKVLLDGIFAINFGDLFVEPYQTRTISRVWQPVGLLNRQAEDAAVFQLFGHMHKRGDSFQIDVVRGGHCSGNPAWACGRDDDCRCWFPQRTRGNCQAGQTCVRAPDAEDSTIYYTDAWDRAPVMNFQPPYLLVNHDQGLRWTCTHTNGIQGDPAHPPKTCKEGCNACGWDPVSRTCIFTQGAALGFQPGPQSYQEGEPMPLVFGETADDDMCNMFGYFITQSAAATLP
jgi:hypothetical protein